MDDDAAAAARELERSVKAGASGGVCATNVEGVNLGELPLDEYWAAAVALDVPVFLHPAQPAPAPRTSEDCLTLNVWTPEWPSKNPKPVMVWFHGGGNTDGWTETPYFYGSDLASHGVVVVTAQYRLGVFGFFAHPELDKESPRKA